ncbi:MAG: hypothetical protein ABEL51_05090 [Salinibacter sp.]
MNDRSLGLLPVFFALLLVLLVPRTRAQKAPGGVDFPMGDVAQTAMGAQGLMGGNRFTGALGPTIIGGETYASLRLQPDLSIGKFGVGLDIPLMVSLEDGSFRSEAFTGGVGPLRLVRYLRYGRERQDPVYVKVGDLSGATLGFGLVMYQYTNVANYEKRDWGTEFNVNYDGKVGLEGLYSDFSELSVVGVRPYVRPFQLAGTEIPLLKNFEVGGIYATDQSDAATPGGEPLTIWGADAGLPISLGSVLQIVPYVAFANIADPGEKAFADTTSTAEQFTPGSGTSVGVNANLQLIADLFSLSAKVERRFFGENFSGSYFGAVYEANKLGFRKGPATHPFRKLDRSKGQNGTFGSLYGHVLNEILIGGSLQIPDKGDNTFLRLEARAPNLIPKVTAHAVYNRNSVEDFGDAFVLDENSTLDARVGYKVKPYLLVGTNYRWTFARVQKNGGEEVKATSHVFPFVALQFQFGNGQPGR